MIYVQQDGRHATRRTGLSATAEFPFCEIYIMVLFIAITHSFSRQ